jgi:hypothetical protein
VILVLRGPFLKNVEAQIALLDQGKPLEAFDQFFAANGVMYANGEIFAKDAAEGRRKQEPYMNSATSILGSIVDLVVSSEREICAFRNRTSFVVAAGKKHQIDGICWQRWQNGKIVEERYFDGSEMQKMLDAGILSSPEKNE